MLGAAAAAAAMVALGSSSAKKSQRWHEKNKAKHKARQKEIKEKYSNKFSEEESKILYNINSQIGLSNLNKSSICCPECNCNFSVITINNIDIDFCSKCRSFWFDSNELKQISGYSRDVPSDNLASRKSKYNCPICNKSMQEYVFVKPHNLLVDQCLEHGVYLENKELNRVIEIS